MILERANDPTHLSLRQSKKPRNSESFDTVQSLNGVRGGYSCAVRVSIKLAVCCPLAKITGKILDSVQGFFSCDPGVSK